MFLKIAPQLKADVTYQLICWYVPASLTLRRLPRLAASPLRTKKDMKRSHPRSSCCKLIFTTIIVVLCVCLYTRNAPPPRNERPKLSWRQHRWVEHIQAHNSNDYRDIRLLYSLAIAVKSHNRPKCTERFLRSVRQAQVMVPIYVGDDSVEPVEGQIHPDLLQGVVFVRTPVDSGTGYGRNRLVEAVARDNFEFIFMADEDYIFPDSNSFLALQQQLMKEEADIVAFRRCDEILCLRTPVAKLIKGEDSWRFLPTIIDSQGWPKDESEQAICVRSDLIQHIFLARISSLLHVRWDDKLKNNDHYDFMFSAKEAGLVMQTCINLYAIHSPGSCSSRDPSDSYMRVRSNRWRELMPYVMKKWDITQFIDERGHLWKAQESGSTMSV